MRTLLTIIAFFVFFASIEANVHCSPEVEASLAAIRRLPEGKQLIESVETNGDLTIRCRNLPEHPFSALWNAETRTIEVNACRSHNRLCSIIFELHNAKTSAELERYFDMAESGELSKEAFVEAVERMEHRNALETGKLIQAGIATGIFPKNCRWPVMQDFDSHYQVQQLYGHSQWIAARYDEVNPAGKRQIYRGTLDPSTFCEADKHDYALYLGIRDNIIHNSESKEHYLNILHREYGLVETAQVAMPAELQRKAALLEKTFATDFATNPMAYSTARTNGLASDQ